MRILVVAPHPDDEAIGCGGTIALNVKQKREVYVLYLTSGEKGMPGTDEEETIKVREKEAAKASNILGSKILDFWRIPDGSVQMYERDTVARLSDLIDAMKFDRIFVPHEMEAHPDHRFACKLVREAVQECNENPECFLYEVWTPMPRAAMVLNISDVAGKKESAIRAHASQVERQAFDEAAMGLSRFRGVMDGKCEYAEVFNRMKVNGRIGMKIALVLFTYTPSVEHERAKYAEITLRSNLKFLSAGEGNEIVVHIADDGSPQEHIENLKSIAAEFGYEASYTVSGRLGYGGSYNLATQFLHENVDLMLPMEDDWKLMKPLNLDPLAKAIEESMGEIRCIRLGYIGFTRELRGRLIYSAGQMFLLFDPNSEEPHVFAGHPRLETVPFERDVGPWPENKRAGDVEWEVTHRFQARIGVVWPLDLGIPAGQVAGNLYGHIGSVSFGGLVPEKVI